MQSKEFWNEMTLPPLNNVSHLFRGGRVIQYEVLRQSGYFSANRYRPSGRRHECAVQAFWTKAKNLAQGQFICPEHVKSPSVAKK